VERVKPLRTAAESGRFEEIFNTLNAARTDALLS
jgi:hypothetical protein